MTICEECHNMTKKRRRCWACAKMVCGYCFHHSFHAPKPVVIKKLSDFRRPKT